MAACSGKGLSRCPDTCTPLWGQCHNLFWASLCCCFLMLPCQLWAVEPISVLSSQARTFLGSFSGAKFSSFEKAKQACLKRRLSMKRHLTVLHVAGFVPCIDKGSNEAFSHPVLVPWAKPYIIQFRELNLEPGEEGIRYKSGVMVILLSDNRSYLVSLLSLENKLLPSSCSCLFIILQSPRTWGLRCLRDESHSFPNTSTLWSFPWLLCIPQ